MRVVLLSPCYPPDPEVGSLRAAKVSQAFAAAGHEVHVVTTRLTGEIQGTRAPGKGMTLHTVRAIPHPRKAYLLAKSWLGRNGPPPSSPPQAVPTAQPGWPRCLLWL